MLEVEDLPVEAAEYQKTLTPVTDAAYKLNGQLRQGYFLTKLFLNGQ